MFETDQVDPIKERDAIIWLREQLSTGWIKHVVEKEEFVRQFGMNTAYDRHGCNTVACIGGWVYLKMNWLIDDDGIPKRLIGEEYHGPDEYIKRVMGGLKLLYYPQGMERWHEITPEHAVKAIDNYLANGNPDWNSVLPW